jgi:hypothetical protein
MIIKFYYIIAIHDRVDPCHHGMTRPQGADGGTASNTEVRSEYIE